MRAAIYARVSTTDQNPDLQIRELRDYCKMRKWEFKIYLDHGISGATEKRPELRRLEKDALNKQFDVVICWRFDRFGRSVSHLLASLDRFASVGIQFVSLRDGIDTGTATGRLLFTLVGAIAEFERNLIRERVSAGIAAAKARGVQLGRPRRIVDSEEIRRLRDRGFTWKVITKKTGLGKGTCQRALKGGTSQ
jgi:DNA invertase Pin-like site-specific DNA recombinase